ncbi:MAG: polysaccharide biosynthesis/export family protein, partial [Planctomycetota bacterium]
MKSICQAGLFALIACLSLGSAGCDNKVLDPTQIGRFRPAPAVNVILDSLGVAEETPVAWENADAPEPRDIVAVKGDYTLRAGDLVRISVFELFQEGATMVNDYVVSESGKVSIPEVGVVQAAGLTETQLEEEIRQILSPAILREPSVTVTLMHSQQRTYSILGNGVPQPGRYSIPRYDFRLTDALANAGGPMQFNVSYVYVSRGREVADSGVGPGPTQPDTGELRLIEPATSARMPGPAGATPSASLRRASPRDIPDPTEPAEPYELERERLGMIVPSAKGGRQVSERIITGAAVPPPQRTISASAMPAGFRLLVPDKAAPQSRSSRDEILISPSVMADGGPPDREQRAPRSGARTEWVFRNGRWVEILVESGADVDAAWAGRAPRAAETGPGQRTEEGLEWVNRNGEW